MSATTTLTESTLNKQDSPVSTLLPTKRNVKVLSEAENGDLYLKVFLLGGNVNGNNWGIDQATVEQNIQSAIGKPLVIYKDTGLEPDRIRQTPYGKVGSWPRNKGKYNHPPWDEHSIEHSKEIQKAFAVGEIKNIAKNQQTGDYWSMIKVTDEDLKGVLKRDPTLPFYVSPQLWRLNKNQPNQALRDWEFMHLAIVSQPAFGVRATVQGSCSGDAESCTSHFMNASLNLPRDESGTPKGCGFCIKNAMKEISEQTLENENAGRTIDNIINLDTSHLTNSSNLKTEERLSDNNNTQNAVNGTPNATTFSENVVPNGRTQAVDSQNSQQIAVEHKTYPQPQTHTYRPNAEAQNNNTQSQPNADKLALIARIEQEKAKRAEALQQLNVLARDNRNLASKANKYEAEMAELKTYMTAQKEMARENGIAELVYNANLSELVPDDKKEEQIKFSLSKGLEPKELAQILSPLYEAFDNFMASQRGQPQQQSQSEQIPQSITANASLNRRESRLKLGATPKTEGSNAFNASKNSKSFSSDLAFERARKLAGMYTPPDNPVVQGGGSY